MFGKLKGFFSEKKKEPVGAPLSGEAVPLSAVNDPVFNQETMGKGIAIIPANGRVIAPLSGTVTALFETKHAIALTSDTGVELLIHVGLDTVQLKGEGFAAHVKIGDHVSAGDLLLEADLEGIKSKGYDIITPVIICNSGKYPDLICHTGSRVQAGDMIMEL